MQMQGCGWCWDGDKSAPSLEKQDGLAEECIWHCLTITMDAAEEAQGCTFTRVDG